MENIKGKMMIHRKVQRRRKKSTRLWYQIFVAN